MRLPTYQWLSQMMAALVVATSLGLVAYELKLSRDVATAELTLSSLTAKTDLIMAAFDADGYNRALFKLQDGDALTREEENEYRRMMRMVGHQWASQFILYEMGLLAEDEWENRLVDIYSLLHNSSHYREYFVPERRIISRGFTERVLVPLLAVMEVHGWDPSWEEILEAIKREQDMARG